MITETTTPAQETIVTVETKRRGRPIVEGSLRQQRINDLNERRNNGTLKLGRPKMTHEQKLESQTKKELFKQWLAEQGK
jgi:hypothetical protein